MAKLFKIIEIEKEGDSIAVTLDNDKTILVDANDFKSFLVRHDRLDYCNDNVQAGEHIQFAGTISFEEYMQSELQYIAPDMYDYIICKKINCSKRMDGLFECLDTICKDYNDKRFSNLQPINL